MKNIKNIITLLILLFTIATNAKAENLDKNYTREEKMVFCTANFAKIGNVGDFVSTHAALAEGYTEANPILNGNNVKTNVLLAKIFSHFLIGYIEDSNIPNQDKILTNKIIGSALMGATVNNFALALFKVEPNIAIISALITGVVVYNNLEDWCEKY